MHVCHGDILDHNLPHLHRLLHTRNRNFISISMSHVADPCRGVSLDHAPMMSVRRFGQCKQTAQEILDLVNECNEVEAEAPREVDAARYGSLDLDTYAP